MTLLLLFSCRAKDPVDLDTGLVDTGPEEVEEVDVDGDGWLEEEDCDDADPAIHPDAEELCDGVDNDCDGTVDLGAVDMGLWYLDEDEDGYGGAEVRACERPSGTVDDAEDCDDEDAQIHPGADELCNDVDDDCDGAVDEESALDATTWFSDQDMDGYGDPQNSTRSCQQPPGMGQDSSDCDDTDPAVNPAAEEVCDGIDDDCDGTVDDPEDLLGSDALCPAEDCEEALDTLTSPTSGLLWIDGGTGTASQTLCDMDTDGGGWTLVMRCVEDAIAYDEALWTDSSVLNETEFDGAVAGCSKYDAYNLVAFTELRTSSTTDLTTDFVEDLATEYSSAQALFSTTGWEISTDFQSYFNELMDPFGQEWGCTTYRSYGINQQDYLGVAFIYGGSYCDWNGGARWGQRVNADHDSTGNHAGQGWGVYSTIGYEWSYAITQYLWVR